MAIDHRSELKSIRTFPALIRYLRDELDWPIENADFEDLTFEYTPEELGIHGASAANIQEIKRLRPLTANQPWGIFFVKFEPKQLPVVVLRRILSRVVLKKRASANSTERAAWAADDLLFISNFGKGEERQISFAHFSYDESRVDLPVLKVLGWDNLDTQLHLDHVVELLHEHLAWPEDEDDADSWRAMWRSAFSLRHREVITTSKVLAERLAELARAIRDRTATVLSIETDEGPVTKLLKAFQEALIHDLARDGFADMYAQTIAYGLLSARIADPKANTADHFGQHMRTSPFLKELLETFLHVGGRKGEANTGTGIDFDELGVSEVVELLDDANMEAVVRDFGDRNPQEDPVIHFYELFLREYDARKRMQRGVFYTPRPVVSYIVRSVDELLRSAWDLADGLADTTTWRDIAKRNPSVKIPDGVDPGKPFVQILDPATGTGTFLVEVIDLIHSRMTDKWKAQGCGKTEIEALWNAYVAEHLLPRLHGYELLMAPYAIAHLKVGLKLYETGYRFASEERARIYLTNALEPAHDFSGQFEFAIPALAHEARAVTHVKHAQRFTVVIGNPPYAGHSSNNQIKWIVDKVYDYKRNIPELAKPGQAKWLQDDYVKFIRLAQVILEESPYGLLGMITNHSFLDNPTFRGMRTSLLGTFPRIHVLNLNGNASERQLAPDGTKDENVFDIQQGVSISLGVRGGEGESSIDYLDLFGARATKYRFLMGQPQATNGSQRVRPQAPHFAFRPEGAVPRAEFEVGVPLPRLMNRNGDPAAGIVTTHDQFAISWTADEAAQKVERLLATDSEEEARSLFRLCSQAQWSYHRAKDELSDGAWKRDLCQVLYRPFDLRWTVFNRNVAVHRRERVMKHMLSGDNIGLISVRTIPPGATAPYALATREVIVNGAIRPSGSPSIDTLFPLYLTAEPSEGTLALGSMERTPNLDATVVSQIGSGLDLQYQGVGTGDLAATFGAEDVFHYIYACLYSSSYRARYQRFLESEFPAVQFPRDKTLFATLVKSGRELVALHVLESDLVDRPITAYTGSPISGVERVAWSDDTVWLDAPTRRKGADAKPGTRGFQGVSEAVWNFRIGGHQVCDRWLKDRKGRTLSKGDLAHYQKIIAALSGTVRLMQEIDKAIEAQGGWPGAFQSEGSRGSVD